MPIRGWVYVITNKAMPNLVKIGYSTKDPALRARELAGTGTPHPFQVVFDVLVENPRNVEQSAHALLVGRREGKEWFRCSEADAIAAVRACAKSAIVERNNSHEPKSNNVEMSENVTPSHCGYYACTNSATSSYRGVGYCNEHSKVMRRQRFAFARQVRDG